MMCCHVNVRELENPHLMLMGPSHCSQKDHDSVSRVLGTVRGHHLRSTVV